MHPIYENPQLLFGHGMHHLVHSQSSVSNISFKNSYNVGLLGKLNYGTELNAYWV